MQCVAVYCSVLQCVAVTPMHMSDDTHSLDAADGGRVLQCDAVYCSVLQGVAGCCSVLQCVAVCCRVLQCVEMHYDELQ